ncbi:uncharacterized protein BXZ73DRAFT_49051 [Epithele typhae]|uniref:uncharacterized protein n=1 Tax=Epithele typhae TaxID=378194 RepID=UPI002007B767|nr:uncharacterized protein BXZ73DRAFT_49051 [Epithele typhae]KAH9927173.1 hypothetical protein BXZ73DRAFT_49051 [Epithele typhae]
MSQLLKRKADDLESSDDEEPALGRQVLPVANLPDAFDGEPTDGLQYLFMVRRDARLLPHVIRVANPYELPQPPPPDEGSNGSASSSSPRKNVLPSEEWRETFLWRFKNFRKNSVQPTIHIHIPDSSAKSTPDKKERDLWWAFLAGRPESEWNPPKKQKQQKLSRWQQHNLKKTAREFEDPSYDAPLPYDLGQSSADLDHQSADFQHHPANGTPDFSDLSTGQPPSTSSTGPRSASSLCLPREPTPVVLQHIDHKYAIHLLMYFTHWISVRLEEGHLPYTDITQAHARWMFALLSRVEEWISGDETSLLRGLARGCMELMAESRRKVSLAAIPGAVPSEGGEDRFVDEGALWMILTAIAGVWGQKDLWEDAENTLLRVESCSKHEFLT